MANNNSSSNSSSGGRGKKDGGMRLIRPDLVAAEYSGASNLMFNELIKQWMVSGQK